MGRVGKGLSIAELILTNIRNFVLSVLFTLGGALLLWSALNGEMSGWWVLGGLAGIAYGLYGFYRVLVYQSRR